MTTTTKERQILFTGPMVRAILDGWKTVTRRIVNPQPPEHRLVTGPLARLKKHAHAYIDAYNGGPFWCWWDEWDRQCEDVGRCPYGIPGDRLWVRETWDGYGGDEFIPREHRMTIYRADYGATPKASGRWHSPRFMPRWASRLTLDVIGVRVERLQEITEADACAEGFAPAPARGETCDARTWFSVGWDEMHGRKGAGFDRNPWVWVVSFRRVTQ